MTKKVKKENTNVQTVQHFIMWINENSPGQFDVHTSDGVFVVSKRFNKFTNHKKSK